MSKSASPRVRVAVIERGKIVEERAVKWRDSVTIGKSAKATLQIDNNSIPESARVLFDTDGEKYTLRFTKEMSGRVQLGRDKPALTIAEHMTAGANGALELEAGCRGKVTIGAISVLFSYEAAGAAPERLVLPREFSASVLRNADPQYALIIGLVAVFQIGLVGYARSQPHFEAQTLEELDDWHRIQIAPMRAMEPMREETQPEKQAVPGPKKGDEPKQEKKPGKKPSGGGNDPRSISDKVRKKGMLEVLGSTGKGGTLDDLFHEGGVSEEIAKAFQGAKHGVRIGNASDASKTRGPAIGEGVGIGDVGGDGEIGDVSSGEMREADLGDGFITPETPRVDGKISQDAIAKAMRGHLNGLRGCYEGALKRNPKLAGKIVLHFEITGAGRTDDFGFDEDSVNSGAVRECIAKRAAYWHFPKPEGGSVFVEYPLVFTPAAE